MSIDTLRARAVGWLWLAAWCTTLYLVASPWRALGGLESERLRWLEWFVLMTGLAMGYTLGRVARETALEGRVRTYVALLRAALYPPALATAAALVLLTIAGERDGPIGVVVTAFLSYWAGLDVASAALPLMQGERWSPTFRGASGGPSSSRRTPRFPPRRRAARGEGLETGAGSVAGRTGRSRAASERP